MEVESAFEVDSEEEELLVDSDELDESVLDDESPEDESLEDEFPDDEAGVDLVDEPFDDLAEPDRASLR